MEFWQNNLTEKSWQILQELKQKHQFVLIGGWAIWLYAHSLKSRDIDIVINFDELERLRKSFSITKNERLKKYEIKIEDIDIDIYLPHYSRIGLPAGEIMKHTLNREGFILPKPEIMLLLKIFVYQSRSASIKGQKDKIDILSLFIADKINFKEFNEFINQFKFEKLKQILTEIIQTTYEVPELNLNRQQFSKLKKKILGRLE